MSFSLLPANWLRAPWAFALVVVTTYGLFTVPILARHGFDVSAFINAGDQFVQSADVASPIIVKPHSAGYDGQFYYRLSVAPFELRQPSHGVLLDFPAWRMQRIFYPLLSWMAALGNAALVPAAMFAVNLLGLAAIAVFSLRIAGRLNLPALTPLAVMLWPGFVVALTHDTTEIVSAALLLGALAAYLADRLVLYALLGALATLTRETGILMLAGILFLELFRVYDGRGRWRRANRALICLLALIPFLAWREILHFLWSESPQEARAGHNIGWPMLGAATMLLDTLSGVRHYSPRRGLNIALRAYAFGTATWLLVWCGMTASRAAALLRMKQAAAVAAGWLPVLALMSLLSAAGPWIDPTAYFRAFTECYVIGCLLTTRHLPPNAGRHIMLAGGAAAWLGAWFLAALQVG